MHTALLKEVSLLGAPANFPLETRTGEPLDPVKVQHDVRALWRARRPADVRVEQIVDGEETRLIFRVEERHTVMLRKIQVEPPTPGIRAGVEPGQQIDHETAQRIALELRKQLEHSGFRQAGVNARLVPVEGEKADLLIHIEKGEAVDVSSVVFAGSLGVPESDLRGALRATKPQTILPGIPGVWNGWRLQRGYNDETAGADLANLQAFYYKRGYLSASVAAEPVDVASGKAHLTFDVDSGPRYAIGQFTLIGAGGERQIPVELRTTPEAACRELLAERREAERAGVLDFNATIDVHEEESPQNDGRRWADLRVTTERGPAYEVGRITFRGNRRFSESVLRGSLELDEGAPLDEMRLRKSIARLNATGFFEQLTERDVVVETPPQTGSANLTISVKEKKPRSWAFSGPVGTMSVAGPLEFSLASRLPSWGQGMFDLSTYIVSARLMLFAKPIGTLIPFLPNKRFIPLLTISRPLLPGQRFLSGATYVPQLGWKGMLMGYGASQVRDWMGPVFQSERDLTPPLAVAVVNGHKEGTMSCEPPKTALDWTRQISGMLFHLAFSFLPF
ncbi:MAG: hypothetical protein JO336_03395 [Acidobacteriia bacterium]|nr:hypothetical protein [Terriglobia bacterium]